MLLAAANQFYTNNFTQPSQVALKSQRKIAFQQLNCGCVGKMLTQCKKEQKHEILKDFLRHLATVTHQLTQYRYSLLLMQGWLCEMQQCCAMCSALLCVLGQLVSSIHPAIPTFARFLQKSFKYVIPAICPLGLISLEVSAFLFVVAHAERDIN